MYCPSKNTTSQHINKFDKGEPTLKFQKQYLVRGNMVFHKNSEKTMNLKELP